MLKFRGASNTPALIFSRPVRQRSADFAGRPAALRSAVESFFAMSATARASEESAQSPFSAPKGVKSEEGAPKLTRDARQPVASPEEKSSSTKYPHGRAVGKMEQTDCPFHEPAIGSGRSRAVSHRAPTISSQADAATECEPSLFLVGQVRPFSVGGG